MRKSLLLFFNYSSLVLSLFYSFAVFTADSAMLFLPIDTDPWLIHIYLVYRYLL